MGEHLPCTQGVRSSSLLVSTKMYLENCISSIEIIYARQEIEELFSEEKNKPKVLKNKPEVKKNKVVLNLSKVNNFIEKKTVKIRILTTTIRK